MNGIDGVILMRRLGSTSNPVSSLSSVKGLCRVLEMMLTGDSNSKAVAVPVTLILALIERVQRMPSTLLVEGPQVNDEIFRVNFL